MKKIFTLSIILSIILFIILTLVLLLMPLSNAQEEKEDKTWIYNSEYLVLENEISTQINIEKKSAAASVEYVEADFSFFPKEAPNQRVLKAEFTPDSTPTPDGVKFKWSSPTENVLPISIKTKVQVMNNPIKITKKIDFPLKGIPSEMDIYKQPAEIIDLNPQIRNLASQLAQGENDAVIIVDKIGSWVTENIKYNLNSAAAEASKRSSWVLENREGVCDELTSLFISLLRSLGIPARFVAGIAYTTSEQFENEWGPHGWAEVYFPGHGWVPYDVTYGEYGFIDPTHITAKTASDAGKIATKFKMKGKNSEIKVDDFKTATKVLEKGKQKSSLISIEAKPIKGSVGFGSYNLIASKIKNLVNYYQPVDVFISQTNELEVLEGHKRHILLEPNEEETIYWTVKVSQSLKEKYLYTFPVSVYALGEVSDKKEFKAIKDGIILTENRIKDMLSKMEDEGEKTFSSNLEMSCVPDRKEYSEKDIIKIGCALKNTGNAVIKELNVCLEDDCRKIDLEIGESKQVNYELKESSGINQVNVYAENEDIAKSSMLEITVNDRPGIEFKEIKHPERVGYDDEFVLEFLAEKKSMSAPKNVAVKIKINSLSNKFNIADMQRDERFKIKMKGSDLKKGANIIRLSAGYEDAAGNDYESSAESAIALENVTIGQSVVLFFKGIINAVVGAFG